MERDLSMPDWMDSGGRQRRKAAEGLSHGKGAATFWDIEHLP